MDVTKVLKEAASNGIDSYFDNVGGQLSYAIMEQMKHFGRIAICGCISAQNQKPIEKLNRNVFQSIILVKQLKVEDFLAFRWIIKWDDAFEELTRWI